MHIFFSGRKHCILKYNMERKCRFSGLAISNAKILLYFSNKIYGSNFIKQHLETVMLWNYQNADSNLRKKFYRVIQYNFRHTFVPYKIMKLNTTQPLFSSLQTGAIGRTVQNSLNFSVIDESRIVCGKRLCVAVGCPSVCLSVPSIDSSSDV